MTNTQTRCHSRRVRGSNCLEKPRFAGAFFVPFTAYLLGGGNPLQIEVAGLEILGTQALQNSYSDRPHYATHFIAARRQSSRTRGFANAHLSDALRTSTACLYWACGAVAGPSADGRGATKSDYQLAPSLSSADIKRLRYPGIERWSPAWCAPEAVNVNGAESG